MLVTPHHQVFKLSAPIDNVPAGATGQLKRLDNDHIALIFNNLEYQDFVFDIHDTEPGVLAAIRPHIVNPSMTDPPRCRLSWWRMAAAAVLAVVAFETFQHTPAYAQVVDQVTHVTQIIPEILFQY